MVQKQRIIIESILKGKSQRDIAKEMRISRNTVSKYVKKYQNSVKKLEEENGKEIDREEIIEEIVQEPKYKREKACKPKMTPGIEKFINKY